MIMLEIQFDFDISGAVQDDAWLDPYDIDLMFEQTKHDLSNSLRRKLANVVCEEHGRPPRIIITGRYNRETEDMDLQYHIDTCCQMFLVRVVKMLNMKG